MFGKKKEGSDDEYIEIDTSRDSVKRQKILVRPFILKEFDDVNPILDSLRTGYTIALVDIRYLKGKDMVELKRAISKLKKTCDALEGNIAGFGDNMLIITPSFAEVYRGEAPVKEERA
ncbi:hypothetical protein AUJ10_00695 [Candidatus Pacearchaeota archaeon CG1_02_31_27]|nr:MAG: hypothetical protein AUJ10_00695 [Candidatus Pacearchaeota archaeon CG1_02_31_27]